MLSQLDRKAARRRVRGRIRRKISGTAERPRLAVFRSQKHIYAQVIDDDTGRTLAHVSTQSTQIRDKTPRGGDIGAAKQVGEMLAQRLKEAGIGTVVFDRGGFIYRGRVKALADAVREGGVKL